MQHTYWMDELCLFAANEQKENGNTEKNDYVSSKLHRLTAQWIENQMPIPANSIKFVFTI